MTGPVRRWHLLALPAVLAVDYLVTVVRHEGCHALVARAFGLDVAEFHVWPPRGVNFSWITLGMRGQPSAWAVPAQAAAPYVAALALIGYSVRAAARMRGGVVRANLIVAGVIFPCAELVTNVLAYAFAPNDLYWVLGTHAVGARIAAGVATAAIVVASGWRATVALGRS